MEGFFVFETSCNDLIFRHSNQLMDAKLMAIAKNMGIVAEDEQDDKTLPMNSLVHIFSPLIANLRFMLIQFDNSFNYIKCQHGFNAVFDDAFGFLFITINDDKPIEYMQRSQGVYVAMIKHLFGPAIHQLKTCNKKSEMLIQLIENWKQLYASDQAVCLEVIEQLSVSNEVKNGIVASLEMSLEKLKQDPLSQRNHAIVFVGNKFLSMFSLRTSQQLTPSDLLFLNIFCQSIERTKNIDSYMLFLRGTGNSCIPHNVHRISITSDVTLFLLSEKGVSNTIATNLYEIFVQLNKIKTLQSQVDLDSLVTETEKLDKNVKNIIEVEKKIKNNSREIEECVKNFQNKYDNLRKRYIEMLKTMDKSQLVKVESHFPAFFEAAKELYRVSCCFHS